MQELKDTTTKRLLDYANNIPSLGGGGKGIQNYLIKYAKNVSRHNYIIELGPYMGSATAFICIGILLSNHGYNYHVWDLWSVKEPFITRAKKYNNIDLINPNDLYDIFCKNIQPFGIYINMHRESLMYAEWNYKNKIELYIDDIGSLREMVNYKMRIFTPAFIPNKTYLFMMDYFYYETHKKCQYQKSFFDNNKHAFKFIERANKKCAIFKYLGGRINYS